MDVKNKIGFLKNQDIPRKKLTKDQLIEIANKLDEVIKMVKGE